MLTFRSVPPALQAYFFDGRIPDDDIWSIVNYLRTRLRAPLQTARLPWLLSRRL